MSEFLQLLEKHLGNQYLLNEWQRQQLESHFELLWRWNKKINLTAVGDVEELVQQHYCESIALGGLLPMGKLRVMDVGSGAGFPGIPLAIARPDCFLLLVDSDSRRSVFLREATMSMMNVLVVKARLNEVQHGADWLVSRAVRWDDIVDFVGVLGDHLALLVSERTAAEARTYERLSWREPIRLPWGDSKVVQIADVSRGT